MSESMQYIVIFLILAIIVVWLIWKLLKKEKGKSDCNCGCSGCDLSESCKTNELKKASRNKSR